MFEFLENDTKTFHIVFIQKFLLNSLKSTLNFVLFSSLFNACTFMWIKVQSFCRSEFRKLLHSTLCGNSLTKWCEICQNKSSHYARNESRSRSESVWVDDGKDFRNISMRHEIEISLSRLILLMIIISLDVVWKDFLIHSLSHRLRSDSRHSVWCLSSSPYKENFWLNLIFVTFIYGVVASLKRVRDKKRNKEIFVRA